MSNLVPTIGALLVPLLSKNNIVGETAMNSLKALATVDSDSLWRGLVIISGMDFPERSILPFTESKGCTKREDFKISTPLHDRSMQLLDYARSLPEQPLF